MTRTWTATAPVRIADLGGWTDTWFAGHGEVCSLAVRPGVEVVLSSRATVAGGAGSVTIDAVDFGDRYLLAEERGRHLLLEACVDEVGVPGGLDVVVRVSSSVPPGASMGTSAAVAVALVGALEALSGGACDPVAVAARAHRIETVRVGRQAGVQDQQSAAHGGANRITMHAYPDGVRVARLTLSATTRAELEARLLVVLLARPHESSAVHQQVIGGLEGAGAPAVAEKLEPLRAAARAGAAALVAGDLAAYGDALLANTAAQAALHPALISSEAAAAFEAARAAGATGWKVNGAGGEGGSLTVLAGDRERAARAIEAAVPGATTRPIALDDAGLRVQPLG